jgi:hypothetical protein
MNETEKLRVAVHTINNERSMFPGMFVDAIRQALEENISVEQLTAIILLSVGVMRTRDLDVTDLIKRARQVSDTLVNFEKHEAIYERKRREFEESFCKGDL